MKIFLRNVNCLHIFSMSRNCCLLMLFLMATTSDLVQGQLPYSSNPPAYEIPPLGVIHEYQRQLEDDIYAVERKAESLAHRECVSGEENFLFCPLTLNIFDFTTCIINPQTAQGADALTRGIKFPSSAFSSTPSVAVGISGIGTGPTCGVKVEATDVYASGFNIQITGGFLLYPFSLKVTWIACPTRQPLNTTVRDFTPKKGVPPPPYFPISYGPVSSNRAGKNTSYNNNNLIYADNQPRYDGSKSGYEESSLPVDEDSEDEETTSSKSSSFTSEATASTTATSSTYKTSTTKHEGGESKTKTTTPGDDSAGSADSTTEA
ncbi:unnamed protein product [Candidula unifasciata]|uniref:H-type lectin domain-containing protein n=1 Tax=Candidula unifasciata TaxID=100452 RepID=A0A8S3YGR8_9EUPU|nr:unnamed protein product [Candidula unifasciata]